MERCAGVRWRTPAPHRKNHGYLHDFLIEHTSENLDYEGRTLWLQSACRVTQNKLEEEAGFPPFMPALSEFDDYNVAKCQVGFIGEPRPIDARPCIRETGPSEEPRYSADHLGPLPEHCSILQGEQPLGGPPTRAPVQRGSKTRGFVLLQPKS